jgi:hypothetical protein
MHQNAQTFARLIAGKSPDIAERRDPTWKIDTLESNHEPD